MGMTLVLTKQLDQYRLQGHPPLDDSDLKSRENWRAKASQENYGDAGIFSDEESFVDCEIHSLSAMSALSDHSYCKMAELQTSRSMSGSLERVDDSMMLDHRDESPNMSQNDRSQSSPISPNVPDTEGQVIQNGLSDNSHQPEKIVATQTIQVDGTKNSGIKKISKYFKACPEVRHMNVNLTKKCKKGALLPNGFISSRPVIIDGTRVFLKKTCLFDSIVHILMTSSIDDRHYASFVNRSDNRTLQLVSKLVTSGSVTKEALENRGEILKNFYPKTPGVQTADRILTYTLDAEDSMLNIVHYVFQSEPSVRRRTECIRCGVTAQSVLCVSPNFNVIIDKGFCAMEEALVFRATYKARCTSGNCGGQSTIYNEANRHLFIELDVRGNTSWKSGYPGKLRQLPMTMKLGGIDEVAKEYTYV